MTDGTEPILIVTGELTRVPPTLSVALTVIAFIFSFAAYVRRNHPVSLQLAAAGHFTLWLAAIGAAVAVLFGWLAYNSVNHDDVGHAAMLLHRSWAITTAVGLILLASWDAWKYRLTAK